MFQKRLLKEMPRMLDSRTPGIEYISTNKINHWFIKLKISNPIYENDEYLLEVLAENTYPMTPPMVKFVDNKEGINYEIPIHPHIYSNGHICLNILGDGWSPAQSIESISISIQSMLASNDVKERPPGDEDYVRFAPKNPLDSKFVYDDDTV